MRTASTWPTPVVALIAGGLVLLLSIGSRQSFGLFLVPMSLDLGWGRETFALAIAIQNLVWGLSQPVLGYFSDRIGASRIIIAGTLFYVAGVYLMALTGGEGAFYFSAGVLVGLGLSGTSFAVVLGAVARVVPAEKRSMALGLVSACGSVGQFVMVPIGHELIGAHGWAGGLTVLAGIVAMMGIFALGCAGRPAEPAAGRASPGRAIGVALGHGGYLLLTIGFSVCGFQITFIITHLPAYLGDQGLTATEAVRAVALIGLCNIFGTLACGALGQRFAKKSVLSVLYAARSVVLVAFLLIPPSATSAYLFAGSMGLLWLGTVPLTGALVAQIFGPRYMATLFGGVFFAHQVGAFLGVWLGGRLYDATGGYEVVWWTCIALGAISALLHLPIDERPVSLAKPARATTW